MWYVVVTMATGEVARYEGFTRDQAADLHKDAYIDGAVKVVSGRMGS